MQRLAKIHEMLIQEPEDSFLNYALALEYAKTANLKKAIELIENVLKRDENYLGAYFQLGKFYEQIGDFQKAAIIYNKGILIAQKKKDNKTLAELSEALIMIED